MEIQSYCIPLNGGIKLTRGQLKLNTMEVNYVLEKLVDYAALSLAEEKVTQERSKKLLGQPGTRTAAEDLRRAGQAGEIVNPVFLNITDRLVSLIIDGKGKAISMSDIANFYAEQIRIQRAQDPNQHSL